MDRFRSDLRAAHYQAVMRYVVSGGIMFSLNLCFTKMLVLTELQKLTSWPERFGYVLFPPMIAIYLYQGGLQLTLALRQCLLRRALRALDGTIPVREVEASREDYEDGIPRDYGTITVCFFDGTPERFEVPLDSLDAIADRLRNSYRFDPCKTSVTRPWWLLQ